MLTTQKKEGKEKHQSRRNSYKKFSNEKIQAKKVSIRRVTDDKYERTLGEQGLNRENIKKLFQIEGHFMVYKNKINVP